jgi:hypothetical protein
MSDLTQRAASLSDIKDIWGLMRQSAGDIPLAVESEAEQEKVLTEIMACCTAGMSPIVVDSKKEIVGALLAKRDQFDWGFRNIETINVAYAAVATTHQDQGVLKTLVEEIVKRNVPIYVGVQSGNKHGLVGELESAGFSRQAEISSGLGDVYKWEPAA